MWETWVQSLGREDPLEKEMVTHSSTLAWRIPWTEKPGRLQSMGSQRVGQDWATSPARIYNSVTITPKHHDNEIWMLMLLLLSAAAAKSCQSCPTLCDPIDGSPSGSHPWDSPANNTGVGCHFLLQCTFCYKNTFHQKATLKSLWLFKTLPENQHHTVKARSNVGHYCLYVGSQANIKPLKTNIYQSQWLCTFELSWFLFQTLLLASGSSPISRSLLSHHLGLFLCNPHSFHPSVFPGHQSQITALLTPPTLSGWGLRCTADYHIQTTLWAPVLSLSVS